MLLLDRVDVEVLARASSRRRSCPRRPPRRGRRTASRAPAGRRARSWRSCRWRSATSEPVGRVRRSPAQGSQRSKTWCRRPVPRVSVRNSVRKPISPRAGTRNSSRTQPVEWLTICSIRPLRRASSLGDDADVVLGHVDRHPLDRLVDLAVDLAGDDLRLAGGQLEALAAHQLEQDDELQLAAALDLPGVGALGVVDPDRDVADQLCVEAVADLARGQLGAVAAGQRGGVDPDDRSRARARRR